MWTSGKNSLLKALYPSRKLETNAETLNGDIEQILPIEAEQCPISKNVSELFELIDTFDFKRKITHLIIHCTATQPTATVSAILRYWKEKRGWKNPGYHVILPETGFSYIFDFNSVSNGASGYNSNGVHVSYIGGIDGNGKAKDTRTLSQKLLIHAFATAFKQRFPDIKIIGHNEVVKKACPSFSVKKVYPELWTGL